MPNPGAFRGSRKEFLMGEKEAYNQAVEGSYTPEALALIFRRYFKRYPLDLPHNQEPSPEHLAAVDDSTPDPEVPEPDIFTLSSEEYDEEMKKLKIRKEKIEFRKNQIKRWMAYQYMKDHHVHPKETGAQNPFRLLIAKLTGKPIDRPRRKTAVNIWRKGFRLDIELELRKKYGTNVPRSQLAARRDEVARSMFARLPKETQKDWELLAEQEHEVAMEQYQKDMDAPFSSDPADRQRAIQALVTTILPILNMACEATGWKATFIAGGPEPAQGGQLNVISIHSGTTSGDVKMTFGHAERQNIKKFLIPMFGAFLQKCFTPVECRSRALLAKDGHLSLSDLDLDSKSTMVHTVGSDRKVVLPPSTSQPIPPASTSSVGHVKAAATIPSLPVRPKSVPVAPGGVSKVASGASRDVAKPPLLPMASSPTVTASKSNPAIGPSTTVSTSADTAIVKLPKSATLECPATDTLATVTADDPVSAEPPTGIVDKRPVPGESSVEGPTHIHPRTPSDVTAYVSEHDRILAEEADTLNRTLVATEDEIDMTRSQSVSPALSLISAGVSPLPSQYPSPIMSPTVMISPQDIIDDISTTVTHIPGSNTPKSTLLSGSPGVALVPRESVLVPNQSKGGKRVHTPAPPSPPAKRPTRTIIKTSKLILLEEAKSQKGKKRGFVEDESTAVQAPAKRRRGGKRT